MPGWVGGIGQEWGPWAACVNEPAASAGGETSAVLLMYGACGFF